MFSITHTNVSKKGVYKSKSHDLYSYTAYVGEQRVRIPEGDSGWLVEPNGAMVIRGGSTVKNKSLLVVIRGYRCESKISGFETISNLPYVNGCSTNQIFPPVRHGDPTMQLLYIPPHAAEQAHHIHSTVRVVYILDGEGVSIQGMNGEVRQPLTKGDVLILDKMTPHHFETGGNHLIAIPIHIYSSTILENSHPMKDGTFIVK